MNLIRFLLQWILPQYSSTVGTIQFEQGEFSDRKTMIAETPATDGRIKGVLIKANEQETFFFSYDESKLYPTFREYGEWDGMVVEAEIEVNNSAAAEFESSLVSHVSGLAHRVFVRSLGTGQLFELPDPQTMKVHRFLNQCRCPMCLGTLVDNRV